MATCQTSIVNLLHVASSGGKTWLSREVTSYFTDSDANFGEILFNELISINNEAIATGEDVKLMLSIPLFHCVE
jgi:hypothetical protein